MKLGARFLGDGKCEFVVWAPLIDRMEVLMLAPQKRNIPLEKDLDGYWRGTGNDIQPGTQYLYSLNSEKTRPDPASCYQPNGVHEASQVVDHGAFPWEDAGWKGLQLPQMVMYELHVGTFTPEGTFAAAIPRLNDLKDAGINTVSLMPVAQFPGDRNWGYDGVYPFAVQGSYGGPDGLKVFVNECHKRGMAVILDVVYNHLGPEGNYLADFGPYFTDKYRTPWGRAINFDGPFSDGVRNYFIENALFWIQYYHIDAFRLDAIHAIYDASARPFLAELSERVGEYGRDLGRKFYLIAESNLNDAKVISPRDSFGYGLDALWCDDFHHSVHTLLTGQNDGYYADFGKLEHLVKCLREGFVYSGEYSAFRKRRHGNSSVLRSAEQFVVCTKNHDQIGNRMLGERMSSLVPFEALKLHLAVTILSPFLPLVFMGDEYAEDAPFQYFVSHSDPGLIEAVREGRREEFSTFVWDAEPPDPQHPDTFQNSKLCWEKRSDGKHKVMLELFRYLLRMRTEIPALAHLSKETQEVVGLEEAKILTMRRWTEKSQVCMVLNFSDKDQDLRISFPEGRWKKLFDSSDVAWSGPGSTLMPEIFHNEQATFRAYSATVFMRQ